MPRYDTYQSNAAEVPVMRKWILFALVLSLALHTGLFFYLHSKKLENFGNTNTARLTQPMRVMQRVNIPKIPNESDEIRATITDKPVVKPIVLQPEKPELTEVRLSPANPDLQQAMVNEKPKADISGSDALAKVEASSKGAMERELNSIAGALIKEGPRSPRQPVLVLPNSKRIGDGGIGDAEGIPGRQTLDDALARTGPLPAGDKPIGMPGGALYEYDSAELKEAAISDLRKLGELVRRNPNATFSIEGHTDAIGDAAYNQSLSELRAESVKAWLVENMGIAPARIQTKGFGSTKLIAPGDGTVEEQRVNRRVELVIKTNRK